MQKKSSVSRRKFFQQSLGLASTLAAGQALGQVCSGSSTAQQGLGPFFPDNGDPRHEVSETPTSQVALANDENLTFVRGLDGAAQGQYLQLSGQLTDRNCQDVAGATVIIWQASDSGWYNHRGDIDNLQFEHPETGELIQRQHDPYFQYWGSTTTDANGIYRFKTIIPGFYPAQLTGRAGLPDSPFDLESNWYRPPHIHFRVLARGKAPLVTQIYFRGDALENNEFIQRLNQRDRLLQGAYEQNRSQTEESRRKLVVDVSASSPSNELEGTFDIQLTN